MANKYCVNETDLVSIADTIREKTGIKDELVFPPEFVTGIEDVYDTGVTNGAKVLDDWWSSYESGSPNYMEYRFAGRGWNSKTFKPCTDMKPLQCNGMFQLFDASGKTAPNKIDEILDQQGVTLDFSKATSLHTAFNSANIYSIGKIDGSSATNWYMAFYACRVEKIKELVFNPYPSIKFTDTFIGAKWLKEIETVSGTIMNTISFADCPLDLPTAKRIINALVDNTTNPGSKTVTFSAYTKGLLEAEGAVWANGTMHWDSYIMTNLGWNC
jgi:hypothetical protein